MSAGVGGIPSGWHVVFDFIGGSVRVVDPLTGEWRPVRRP